MIEYQTTVTPMVGDVVPQEFVDLVDFMQGEEKWCVYKADEVRFSCGTMVMVIVWMRDPECV